jgi:hypothetical protein
MRILLPLFLVFAITACNRQPAAAPSPAPSAQAPASEPAAADTAAVASPKVDTANCAFCAEPSFVRTCEIASGVRTTLYWNIADPSIARVSIFVVDDAGKDSPFAEQPSKGSIQTGPWLKPGLTFKLKAPDGKVLETLVISGQDC